MSTPFLLPLLPYSEDALEPFISARTIGIHYHKHHKTYVDTLNKLVVGTRYLDMPIVKIVRETVNASNRREKKIFNNAAQAWNHDFYWRSLTAHGGEPAGDLKIAIERDFGTVDTLIEELAEAGMEQFGSGWVWLISKSGRLSVEKTADAVDPMAMEINCLLAIDVWEHAYYLDYQNERPKYLQAVLSKLLNWEFARENLTKEPDRRQARYEGTRRDAFSRPEDITNAKGLLREQKMDLLKQWELDLRQVMVASEENITGTEPGETAELLRRVRVLLTSLGAPERELAAVTKAGG